MISLDTHDFLSLLSQIYNHCVPIWHLAGKDELILYFIPEGFKKQLNLITNSALILIIFEKSRWILVLYEECKNTSVQSDFMR